MRPRDREALRLAGQRYLELMRDIDRLLGTRREFLLGAWLRDAKRWATTDEERRLLEWNARNLITLWGPRDSILHEYAYRQWSGLIRGFYLKRWEMFLDRLNKSLETGKAFDAAEFEREIRAWEEDWTHGTESYPTQPAGDPVLVGQELWAKYRDAIRKPVAPDHVSLSTGKPTACSSVIAADSRPRWPTTAAHATPAPSGPPMCRSTANPWWQVDLEAPTAIGRVVVVSYYGDERYYGFTVQTSLDGKSWDVVADQRDNKLPSTRAGYTCQFAPRKARFVRVTLPHNSANTGRHLVEVMVYEALSAVTSKRDLQDLRFDFWHTVRRMHRVGRRRIELQGAAGGLRSREDRVLHLLDVDAFLAQQIENAGQHADAIVVSDDQRMGGRRTCAHVDRIDGLARLAEQADDPHGLLGDRFRGFVGRGADVGSGGDQLANSRVGEGASPGFGSSANTSSPTRRSLRWIASTSASRSMTSPREALIRMAPLGMASRNSLLTSLFVSGGGGDVERHGVAATGRFPAGWRSTSTPSPLRLRFGQAATPGQHAACQVPVRGRTTSLPIMPMPMIPSVRPRRPRALPYSFFRH